MLDQKPNRRASDGAVNVLAERQRQHELMFKDLEEVLRQLVADSNERLSARLHGVDLFVTTDAENDA